MWHVYCDECASLVLVDTRQITELINLAPGVIALTLRCPAGHLVQILSGRATQDPQPPA